MHGQFRAFKADQVARTLRRSFDLHFEASNTKQFARLLALSAQLCFSLYLRVASQINGRKLPAVRFISDQLVASAHAP